MIQEFRRLLKIYFAFVRFSFSKATEFRLDSVFIVLADFAFYFQFYFFINAAFTLSPNLGGWTKEHAQLFSAMLFVNDAISSVFLQSNIEKLPKLVVKGDFDYYLMRPAPALFQVALREIILPGVLNVIFSVIILFYAVSELPNPLTITQWGLLTFFTLNGVLLLTVLRLLSTLPAFWGGSERAFMPAFWGLATLFDKPHVIYKGIVRYAIMTIVPFALICSLPSEVVLKDPKDSINMILYIIVASFTFYYVTLKIWGLAIRNYSSASS